MRTIARNSSEAVLAGLSRTPRAIPAKFLYDARGLGAVRHDLRAAGILPDADGDQHPAHLCRRDRRAGRVRLCAGRVRQRLEREVAPAHRGAPRSRGVRADRHVATASRRDGARGCARDYPWLKVEPVCADYMALSALPGGLELAERRLGFFPGSTIGNLEPEEATAFLRRARACSVATALWCWAPT